MRVIKAMPNQPCKQESQVSVLRKYVELDKINPSRYHGARDQHIEQGFFIARKLFCTAGRGLAQAVKRTQFEDLNVLGRAAEGTMARAE